jgi:hypothetical protein
VPKANDPLSYMVFAKQIQDAQTFFGPQALNVKRLKHRFAQLTGNDFDTWFIPEKELELQQKLAEMSGVAGNSPQGGQNPGGNSPAPGPGKVPGKSTGNGPSIAMTLAGKQPATSMGSLMR